MLKLHANARTCPHSRWLAVERVGVQGWTLTAAAEAAGDSHPRVVFTTECSPRLALVRRGRG